MIKLFKKIKQLLDELNHDEPDFLSSIPERPCH